MKKNNKNQVLIHACCAICSGYPIQKLQELGYEPIVYFFNPNIHPETEYKKRLEAQEQLCDSLNCKLIVEDYTPNMYNDIMSGFSDYKEGSVRCKRCFEQRLLRTVQKAKELEIGKYTTSISVSPHKNFEFIKEAAENLSNYFQPEFLAIDFKKEDGFLKSNQISKELSLYRQNYCGCEVSMKMLKAVGV